MPGMGAITPPLTGPQILAQVKTLAGAGSGLDADTVRGSLVVTAALPGGASLFQPISQPGQLFPSSGRSLATNYLGR